ncbi:hypothetical protein ALC56_06280 [Trachymyrmex septentrionalis]|uniref:Uncharacterized protein n=1 Tax=Trachymyrmex septentrionalis TaxID=34720 RepID=A0A195FH64_9HYME|nr:hypothetical protein ALC56_06280 [Trachymyrmex septentrionalis]
MQRAGSIAPNPFVLAHECESSKCVGRKGRGLGQGGGGSGLESTDSRRRGRDAGSDRRGRTPPPMPRDPKLDLTSQRPQRCTQETSRFLSSCSVPTFGLEIDKG